MLRIVGRNGLTHDLADLLVEDLTRVLPEPREQDRPHAKPSTSTAFHH
ncbi:hypothetical protein GCM10017786_41800 [Amycolatopsis deserti]|uniref:Uncharacterized protein n=1 Tax=Amycolatopsis deserti TaxID=185696 RepID=A0ABQ3J7T0_9PSEU|nr:hypothetical protein GCM10017786_41800 [Amycolatopsis deserti]